MISVLQYILFEARTVSARAFQVHARGECALGTDCTLDLHPVLWARLLYDFGLEDETGVSSLSH